MASAGAASSEARGRSLVRSQNLSTVGCKRPCQYHKHPRGRWQSSWYLVHIDLCKPFHILYFIGEVLTHGSCSAILYSPSGHAMSSFLSKVFGRKKDDKESPRLQGRASDGSLLEGKYEAVSPTVSPLATHFSEVTNGKSNLGKEKEKDLGFALFKAKSRTSSSDPPSQKRLDLPHLSLNLPGPKEDSNSRALGVVFEGDCSQLLLADSVIGERRLNPLETLVLVRACSQAIAARGTPHNVHSLISTNFSQVSKPSGSCTLIGIPHLRKHSASSFLCSSNLWLPKAQ